MAGPRETIWEIPPHTRAKHEILRRYLQAWFPILNRWNGRIVYIDGFCGPGGYKGGEPGSPLIALDVAINHRRTMSSELLFTFIDEREDRIVHLREELRRLPAPPLHFKVSVQLGKFDEKLQSVLDYIDAKGARLAPTFAFIDPFGFSGIPFALIERLLKQRRCEALITFMVDAINRFLEHPQNKVVSHIVEAFGTDQATSIAESSGNRIDRLRELYQAQLRRVAKFVRYFEMRDQKNRPQYYLFFASNHEVGHLKMKEAMWAVDPEGEFRFSDATDPNQRVLFGSEPSAALPRELRKQYRGKGMLSVRAIRKYVENETPYLSKHMRRALSKEEVEGKIKVEPMKADGRRRRAATFPDDAWITFI